MEEEDKNNETKTDDDIMIIIGRKCKDVGDSKSMKLAIPKSKGVSKKKHISVNRKRWKLPSGLD